MWKSNILYNWKYSPCKPKLDKEVLVYAFDYLDNEYYYAVCTYTQDSIYNSWYSHDENHYIISDSDIIAWAYLPTPPKEKLDKE